MTWRKVERSAHLGSTFSIPTSATWIRGIEVDSFQLASGQRHDVIIDFRDAPDEVYLENLMFHADGRGGNAIREDKRTQMLKFEVSGSNFSEPRCEEGTVIRGFHGIDPGGQFSFHDEAEELLKAAFALLIWGGKVLVISTHNGIDNPFNQLIQAIREAEELEEGEDDGDGRRL